MLLNLFYDVYFVGIFKKKERERGYFFDSFQKINNISN